MKYKYFDNGCLWFQVNSLFHKTLHFDVLKRGMDAFDSRVILIDNFDWLIINSFEKK